MMIIGMGLVAAAMHAFVAKFDDKRWGEGKEVAVLATVGWLLVAISYAAKELGV